MCSIVLLAFMLTLHERTLNRLSRLGEDKPSPLLCLRMHRLTRHERTLNRLSRLGEDKPSPLLCLRMHRLAKPVHNRGTLSGGQVYALRSSSPSPHIACQRL